jgi:hypothetical protein
VTLVDRAASKSALFAAMLRLAEASRPGDEILVYYSGHGTSRADPSGAWPLPHTTGALIPADFRPVGSLEEQVERLVVGRTDLRRILEALDAGGRHTFVVVDACFSGNAVRTGSPASGLPVRFVPLAGEEGESAGVRGAGSDDYPYRRVLFLSAAREHEFATDITARLLERFPTDDGLPHGAFTDALLRVLRGGLLADEDGNGRISYRELERSVDGFMRERGYAQRPRLLPDDADLAHLAHRPIFGAAAIPPERTAMFPFRPTVGDAASATGVFVGSHEREALLERIERGPGTGERLAGALDMMRSSPRKGALVAGERISFRLASRRAAYLVLLALDSEGEAVLLHPRSYAELRTAVSGDTFEVPNPRLESPIVVSPPFGRTDVVLLAYARPPAVLTALLDEGSGGVLDGASLEHLLQDLNRLEGQAILRLTTVSAETGAGGRE